VRQDGRTARERAKGSSCEGPAQGMQRPVAGASKPRMGSATSIDFLTSLAVDLSVTQLVDGTKGIHAKLPKPIFGRY